MGSILASLVSAATRTSSRYADDYVFVVVEMKFVFDFDEIAVCYVINYEVFAVNLMPEYFFDDCGDLDFVFALGGTKNDVILFVDVAPDFINRELSLSFSVLDAELVYAFSDSLLLTPLCCDDIHDVTPRVSALAGCDIRDSKENPCLLISSAKINRSRNKSSSGTKKQAGLTRQEASTSNSFDALNTVENDDELGLHPRYLVVQYYPLALRINDLERKMLDGKLVLMDDDGKPQEPSKSNTSMRGAEVTSKAATEPTLVAVEACNMRAKKVDDLVNADSDSELNGC
ncbi:hypothetical protein Tco_0471633 [Tanacetum coccineum]